MTAKAFCNKNSSFTEHVLYISGACVDTRPRGNEVTEDHLIGAHLSEPHTSVTALQKYLCLYVCLFGPTTYRKFQMSAFQYFTMIACHVHADVYFS